MDPISLISNEDIENVVKLDCGSETQLISWKTINFTKDGDNYCTFVTSIEAEVKSKGKLKTCYYIVKLNPCRDSESWNSMSSISFRHEIEFLSKIGPMLNKKYLKSISLNMATCLASSDLLDKEFIISNDFRQEGFKMVPKSLALDADHTSLVFVELAKLHASGYMLLQDTPYEDLVKSYPGLTEGNYSNIELMPFLKMLMTIIKNLLNLSTLILKKYPQYSKVSAWIKEMEKDPLSIIQMQTKYNPSSVFNTIVHGDCWQNNLLFRYSGSAPEAVVLLDLQLCRISSLATDITYFLYSSTSGDMRRPSLNNIIDIYYKTYSKVILEAGRKVPFTIDELKAEIKHKSPFGFIIGLFITPYSSAPEDCSELNKIAISDDNIQEQYSRILPKMVPMFTEKRVFMSRFISIIEDIENYLE